MNALIRNIPLVGFNFEANFITKRFLKKEIKLKRKVNFKNKILFYSIIYFAFFRQAK
jgi:hypothetical protein